MWKKGCNTMFPSLCYGMNCWFATVKCSWFSMNEWRRPTSLLLPVYSFYTVLHSLFNSLPPLPSNPITTPPCSCFTSLQSSSCASSLPLSIPSTTQSFTSLCTISISWILCSLCISPILSSLPSAPPSSLLYHPFLSTFASSYFPAPFTHFSSFLLLLLL